MDTIQSTDDRLPEEEIHESGCDCNECRLNKMFFALTKFELFCLNWYRENVSHFTFEANMVGKMIEKLNLKGLTRIIFLKAMNIIRLNELSIQVEIQNRRIEEARRG